ncbi:MAG: hypothetical protein V4507_09725, partial [Verrucomicrobiota bacterium]
MEPKEHQHSRDENHSDHKDHEKESSCNSCGHDHSHDEGSNLWKEWSVGIGAFATVAGLIAEHLFKSSSLLNDSLYAIGMTAGGWFLLPEAFKSLLRFRPNINALVVIA